MDFSNRLINLYSLKCVQELTGAETPSYIASALCALIGFNETYVSRLNLLNCSKEMHQKMTVTFKCDKPEPFQDFFELDRDAFAITKYPNSSTIRVNKHIVDVIVTTEFMDWVESKLRPKQ